MGKSKARVMMKKLKEKIKAFDSASVEQVKIIIHYKYPNLSFYFDKAVKSNLIRTAYCYIYSRRRRHWVEAVVNTDKNELYWITCCELHKDYFEKLSKELDLKFIDLSEIEIEDQFTEKVKIENIDSVHAKAAYFFIKNGFAFDLNAIPPAMPKKPQVKMTVVKGKHGITGDTYPYREFIKSYGGEWSWYSKAWIFDDKEQAEKCFSELLKRVEKDYEATMKDYEAKMAEYQESVKNLEEMIRKVKIEEKHKFIIAYDLPSENLKGIDALAKQIIRNTRVKATIKLQVLGLQSTQSVILSSKDRKQIEETVSEVMKLYDQLNSVLRGEYDFTVGRPLIKIIEITQTQFLAFKDLAEKQLIERLEGLIEKFTDILGEIDLITDEAKKHRMLKNFKQQKRSVQQIYELAKELGINIDKQYKLLSEMIETAIEVLEQ